MDHNAARSAITGPLYPFEGRWPVVHPSAFVAPTAAVIVYTFLVSWNGLPNLGRERT